LEAKHAPIRNTHFKMLRSILIHVDSKALKLERLIRPTLYITHVICLASQHWQKEDCAFLSCFFFFVVVVVAWKGYG